VVEREVRERPAPKKVERVEITKITAKTHEVNRSGGGTQVFSQAMDVMSEGVGTSDIFDEVRNQPLKATFKGSGFVLSAGFLTWALRGASLMASVAATLPAWQGFDPLPVLAGKRAKSKPDEEDKREEDWQESRVRRLLNPLESSGEE
jgi:hypothetical protein